MSDKLQQMMQEIRSDLVLMNKKKAKDGKPYDWGDVEVGYPKGWLDVLLYGVEMMRCEIVDGKPVFTRIDPKDVEK